MATAWRKWASPSKQIFRPLLSVLHILSAIDLSLWFILRGKKNIFLSCLKYDYLNPLALESTFQAAYG